MSEVTIPFMSRLKAIRDRMSIQAEGEASENAAPVAEAAPKAEAVRVSAPSGAEPSGDQSLGNMWALENEPEDEARAPEPEAEAAAEPVAVAEPEPPVTAKAEPVIEPAPEPEPEAKADEAATSNATTESAAKAEAAPVPQPAAPAPETQEPEVEALSVWEGVEDLDDEVPSDPGSTPQSIYDEEPENRDAEAERRPMRRAGRTKTRLLSVDHADGKPAVDLFAKAKSTQAHNLAFPYGWLVVVEGPGRGEYISVQSGVSQIGRDEDQAVQLDFGDMTISRQNHAAIAYDEDAASFFIGHGGKSNIVRLNGKPLLSTELVKNGDKIKIGETTLRLVTLCGADFSWAETPASPNNNG